MQCHREAEFSRKVRGIVAYVDRWQGHRACWATQDSCRGGLGERHGFQMADTNADVERQSATTWHTRDPA